MATLALACHTTDAAFNTLPGGHTYLIFSEPEISVGELLQEKVRAEFRKQRAGGRGTSSLDALVGYTVDSESPYDERAALFALTRRFNMGDVHLFVDGIRASSLSEPITLTRRTGLHVVVPFRKDHDVETNVLHSDAPVPVDDPGSARRR